MNEFNLNQIRFFKSFLTFALVVLVTSLIIINSSSQKFRISEIDHSMKDQFFMESLNSLYGRSIWFVDENSFDQIYKDNPDIKNLNITKRLPNKLIISIDLYQQLANLIDLRSSVETYAILYENAYIVSTLKIDKTLPIVKIENGPVESGFNGELISLFKTLDNYQYTKQSLEIKYDGDAFNAYYGKTTFQLGDAVDLGRKASILGTYLSDNSCDGTVKFLTSESTIENCK
ncbi:FtsQ-type POTRA domain-containing protein [Acidimicrobiia bacterium]|nr:FtsQ-type POTRA domain-containing protein [Acidimicrobiia bacterium]MDB2455736.1 FtsQ-type POTRA domain-containing protein [Candidatus Actinomarina sp.]